MSGPPKISVTFTKKIDKQILQRSAFHSDAKQVTKINTEIIESIEGNVIKTDAILEANEPVIPMVLTDRRSLIRKYAEKKAENELKLSEEGNKSLKDSDSNEEKLSITTDATTLTLDEQAAAAVIEESKRKLDGWTERGTTDSRKILQAEQKHLAESADGKESTLDDYDQVEVDVYGAALLRGMGWKKTEGIGRINKKVVDIIDPTSKPFGLSTTPGEKKIRSGQDASGTQEDELCLTNGSCVFIVGGRHRGSYGIVESIDPDHVLVKLAVVQNVIREVELNVKVVSQKEYKDSSRVINKDMYDKFKEDEARKKRKNKSESNSSNSEYESEKREIKKEKLWKEKSALSNTSGAETSVNDSIKKKKIEDSKRDIRDCNTQKEDRHEKLIDKYRNEEISEDESKGDIRNDHKSSRDIYSKSTTKYASKERIESNNSQDKYKEKCINKREVGSNEYSLDYKAKKAHEKTLTIPWVRENLRVRLISKAYRNGKYHKEKVIVRSVETAVSCECITYDGRVLKEVHPGWLETVIPKVEPKIVMIVKGNSKGQKGRILQLHKDQEKASLQLLDDATVILKLHYDDICEYVSGH